MDFEQQKVNIDEIILPMSYINCLTMSKMERVWTVNNSIANEPQNMHEATQQVVHTLDAKYEKADLQSVVITNCSNLSLQEQNKTSYQSYTQNLRNTLMEH